MPSKSPHSKKIFTRWLIVGLIGVLVYFALYQPDYINIEGDWSITSIEQLGESTNNSVGHKRKRFEPNRVAISSLSKTIIVFKHKKKSTIRFTYLKDKYKIQLYSQEKVFNGVFTITLDTIYPPDSTYEVDLVLQSTKTRIAFKRKVFIKPFKPQIPQKGMP